jgi:hypothetical protein
MERNLLDERVILTVSPFLIPFIFRARPFRGHKGINWQFPPFGTILTLGPLMSCTVKKYIFRHVEKTTDKKCLHY